jgi:hypothetical protein
MSLTVCFSFELRQVSGAMVINVAMDGYGQANSSVSLFGWLVAGDWC